MTRRFKMSSSVGRRLATLSGHCPGIALVGLLGACAPADGSAPADPPLSGTDASTVGSTNSARSGASTPQLSKSVEAPSSSAMQAATGAQSASSTPASAPTTPSVSTPEGAAAQGGSIIPCDVLQALAANCQSCHAAAPIGGAPMPLVSYADLHAPAKTQPNMKVYELAKQRIHDTSRPMPPVGRLAEPQLAALDAWFDAGALAGNTQDAACEVAKPKSGGRLSARDFSHGRAEPGPGETCYEFKVHQSTTSVDDAPFEIPIGEQYEQFYYNVPWPEDSVAVLYGTIVDNPAVLHHWLLFATSEVQTEGAHHTSPVPTLFGTDPTMLAGWAVGGPNFEMPEGVGMELPNPGRTINTQWHFYNSTDATAKTAASIQICTVPKSMRPNIASITWGGTEDLNGSVWTGGPGMPPNQESTFTTTCHPGRTDTPIHIFAFEPHMHRIGKRMTSSLIRANGKKELVFDEPFSFGTETHYLNDQVLMPGDALETSCTFFNDTDKGVPFGESTDAEMCFQFVFHYPAHALSNGGISTLGVSDICW